MRFAGLLSIQTRVRAVASVICKLGGCKGALASPPPPRTPQSFFTLHTQLFLFRVRVFGNCHPSGWRPAVLPVCYCTRDFFFAKDIIKSEPLLAHSGLQYVLASCSARLLLNHCYLPCTRPPGALVRQGLQPPIRTGKPGSRLPHRPYAAVRRAENSGHSWTGNSREPKTRRNKVLLPLLRKKKSALG